MYAPPAQTPPAVIRPALTRGACAGESISRIEIHRHAPSPRTAAQRSTEAPEVEAETDPRRTRAILAYVRLAPGRPCTERDRRESERMLRAQPYLSSAQITARPEPDGRVRLRIDVVDEFPWLLSGRVTEAGVAAVRVGTLDLQQRGRSVSIGAERGGAYRDGAGLRFAQYGILHLPAVATLAVERRPLGALLQFGVSSPFLSVLQREAFDAGLAQETEYTSLLRPGQVAGAVRTQRSAWHLGWVHRLGPFRDDRVLGLAGVMLVGADVRTTNAVVVVTDSGLVGAGDSVLIGRFADHGVSRLALMVGARALRFITVRRFDALRAAQDVGVGTQVSLMVAPAAWRPSVVRDLLVAGDLYAGVGSPASFASVSARAEARPTNGLATGRWAGVVVSSRLSWHRLASARRTRVVSLSVASLHGLDFPAQLDLRDPDGGLIAFPSANDAGGQRAVARLEERVLLPGISRRLDAGLALFIDGGRVWAGDAPYGVDSPVRSSAGIAILAAIPAGGKRMYRLDIGLPVGPVDGGPGLAFRFSVADRTGVGWAEPMDVTRARSGSGRMSLMRW